MEVRVGLRTRLEIPEKIHAPPKANDPVIDA